jgi:hypothetical protein
MYYEKKEEEFERILAESRNFRDECKKTILASKQLCDESYKLTKEIKHTSEEAAVLLEEEIVLKEEALAILKIAQDGKEMNKLSSAYSIVEEKRVDIKNLYEMLSKIKIDETNLPLFELKKKFDKLSFLLNKQNY